MKLSLLITVLVLSPVVAWAQTADEGEVTVSHIDLTLPEGVRARLVHADQHGEPTDNDQRLRVEVHCPKEHKPHVLIDDLAACEFGSFHYLKEKDLLELRFKVASESEGILSCTQVHAKTYKPACH